MESSVLMIPRKPSGPAVSRAVPAAFPVFFKGVLALFLLIAGQADWERDGVVSFILCVPYPGIRLRRTGGEGASLDG